MEGDVAETRPGCSAPRENVIICSFIVQSFSNEKNAMQKVQCKICNVIIARQNATQKCNAMTCHSYGC